MESTLKFEPGLVSQVALAEDDDEPPAFLYQWMDLINNSWKSKIGVSSANYRVGMEEKLLHTLI